MLFIRQGATHKVLIGPAVAVGDGFTPVTTLALNAADEAEAILHDNGTVVDISGYTFAAIASADGYYHLTLQSGISNTVGHMTVVINDDSLILPIRADFTVLEEATYDMLFAGSALGYIANAPVNVAQFGGAAGTFAAGRPEVNTTHAAGTAWASGAITAASIATDAIDADALAANALAEINAEVVDALNVDAYAELSSVPAATATMTQMIRWLYLLARNKLTSSASTLTIKADNGSTNVATAAKADSGGVYTRDEWA